MQGSFARKYAIMEELDGGFGAGSTPEAFVRLDSWEGRIQAAIHVKGLKQGPFKYRLYLIFADRDRLKPILLGDVNNSYSGMQSGLEIDAQALIDSNIRPDSVRYAALTAESQNKKWIPLFSSFEKNSKWDESIRQVLFMLPKQEPKKEDFSLESVYTSNMSTQEKKQESLSEVDVSAQSKEIIKAKPELQQSAFQAPSNEAMSDMSKLSEEPDTRTSRSYQTPDEGDTRAYRSRGSVSKKDSEKSKPISRSNLSKLEGLLANNFEVYHPFKRASKGYLWYKVSDLAQLSNIMYMSGINVPLFANPKILVGLFKFKHILAGICKGDMNDSYYVIGVPAKNENDNKPFENACRWTPIEDSEIRDMTGYWLVYVSLDSGEIVV